MLRRGPTDENDIEWGRGAFWHTAPKECTSSGSSASGMLSEKNRQQQQKQQGDTQTFRHEPIPTVVQYRPRETPDPQNIRTQQARARRAINPILSSSFTHHPKIPTAHDESLLQQQDVQSLQRGLLGHTAEKHGGGPKLQRRGGDLEGGPQVRRAVQGHLLDMVVRERRKSIHATGNTVFFRLQRKVG